MNDLAINVFGDFAIATFNGYGGAGRVARTRRVTNWVAVIKLFSDERNAGTRLAFPGDEQDFLKRGGCVRKSAILLDFLAFDFGARYWPTLIESRVEPRPRSLTLAPQEYACPDRD